MKNYMVEIPVIENPVGVPKHLIRKMFESEESDCQNLAAETVTNIVTDYVLNLSDIFLPYIDVKNVKLYEVQLTEIKYEQQ